MISNLIETNYYFASSVYLQPFNFNEDTGRELSFALVQVELMDYRK